MFACINKKGTSASGCAFAFSPRVEEIDADTVVLDVSGLSRLMGTPRRIAESIAARAGAGASIAIAAGRDASIYAARGFRGITLIPRGDEAARLGDLAVELLGPPPDIQDTLDRWGIRTFRDLAGLPETGVAERLGAEGVRLQKLACGESVRPFRPTPPSPVFEEALDLEHPVETLEPLSFLLARLLNQLCGSLADRALAALSLDVELKLEGGALHTRVLRLPVPMRDPKIFLKLLQLDLDAHPPSGPVIALAIRAEPARPRTAQEGLFLPPSPEPEKLELTLARLAGVVGEQNVGSPELVDSHRPGAFVMTKAAPLSANGASGDAAAPCRLAFRVFRPPLTAKVQPPAGPPASIAAKGVHGKILSLAGPWRTSGDWWTPEPWARDDWDIALDNGLLYRIYREEATGWWFIEGRYD